jgi:hypothetical protein
MTREEFAKFVEQKTLDEQSEQPINREERKQEWLKRLADFYSEVEKYLAEYIQSGKISIESSSISINEPHIGYYMAESKTILLGSDKIQLCPIGTVLIGATGRVDMIGPAGTVKFILTGKNSNGIKISIKIAGEDQTTRTPHVPKIEQPEEYVWKIATPPPRVRFMELNPETFFNALMEVVNG